MIKRQANLPPKRSRKGWFSYKLKNRFKNFINKNIELIVPTIFLVIVFIIILGFDFFYYDKSGFSGNLIAEGHGLAFDILVFGVLIIMMNRKIEKKRDIKRYQEEIDDMRGWDDVYAKFRIMGSIRRLNRLGYTRINLTECYLEKALLTDANLRECNLSDAILDEANLSGADLTRAALVHTEFNNANLLGATLVDADLSFAFLRGADLSCAELKGAILRGAKLKSAHIEIAQLAEAKTLFEAELDIEVEKDMRNRYPHLFENWNSFLDIGKYQ